LAFNELALANQSAVLKRTFGAILNYCVHKKKYFGEFDGSKIRAFPLLMQICATFFCSFFQTFFARFFSGLFHGAFASNPAVHSDRFVRAS
jgi:hypothetical protein